MTRFAVGTIVVMYLLCDVCGGYPAVHGTFRGALAFLFGLSMRTVDENFCRDCGLATFRELQKYSLVAGWWGIAFLGTVFAVVRNANQIGPIARLPAPTWETEPPPGVGDRFGRPLRPGSPVVKSPAVVVPIVLGVLLFLFCCGPRFFYE